MKVSIGLPTYNHGKYLRSALDALLLQTFRDFELIISDNASTDDTEVICWEYMRRDERVKYIRYPHMVNGWKNRNRTIEMARGKYVMNACSDDIYASTFLEKCVAVLDSDESVVLCHSGTDLMNEEGKIYGRYKNPCDVTSDNRAQRILNVMCSLDLCNSYMGVMRTDAVHKTQLFRTDVHSADSLFLAEMSLLGKFYEIQETLFLRRLERPGRTPEEWMFWQDAGILPPYNGVLLPWIHWTRAHIDLVLLSDLPSEDKEELLSVIPKIFIGRWGHMMSAELNHAFNRINYGILSQRWQDKNPSPGGVMVKRFEAKSIMRTLDEGHFIFGNIQGMDKAIETILTWG